MSDAGGDLPTPAPALEPDSAPYWLAAGRGELRLPECSECRRLIWIPRPFCAEHPHAALEWVRLSGRGTIYSFTAVARGDGAYAGVSYVLAYVELAEGPRIMTNIVGADPAEVRIDQEVEVVFSPADDGLGVPRFRPV